MTATWNLNIGHLWDTYIVDSFEDMHKIKKFCKGNNSVVLPLIVYTFATERYPETAQFTELEDFPDVVANIFLDELDNPDLVKIVYSIYCFQFFNICTWHRKIKKGKKPHVFH